MKKVNIILRSIFSVIIVFGLFKVYEIEYKSNDSIEEIHYSEKTALEDIRENKVVFVTDDRDKYKLNKKYNYTKEFGFIYKYEEEKKFHEFNEHITIIDENGKILNPGPSNEYSISDYNSEIEKYLATKDSFWYKKLRLVEDSLKFMKIDNYGEKYPIEIQSLRIPKEEDFPITMMETIEMLKSETERLFRRYEKDIVSPLEVTQYEMDFLLRQIDSNTNYNYIWKTQFWAAYHYQEILIELIKRVGINKEIGLSNTYHVIRERCETGEMQWHEHFSIYDDDLYKVSGRANHLLKMITGEDFGYISVYHSDKDVKRIQHRWIYWLKNLNKRKKWF